MSEGITKIEGVKKIGGRACEWGPTCPHCGSDQVRFVLSKVKPAFMICLNCHFSDSKLEEGQ